MSYESVHGRYAFDQMAAAECERDERTAWVARSFDGAPRDPLAERAARLYPDNEALQQEWRRAVRVVRATEQGWVLERRVERRGA